MLIKYGMRSGPVKEIQIFNVVDISYLLFVDDSLIFGQGSLKEIIKIKYILDTYCGATCTQINVRKLAMMFNVVDEEEKFKL
jgi:hypothetical protein